MTKPETLWQAQFAAEYHLFRRGLTNTREMADLLDMDVPATRRMLDRMARDGRVESWDGTGVGAPGAPALWSLPDQPDPMDPEKRHKADLDGVPTTFFKMDCARYVGDVYTPYSVLVTAVEVSPRRWRAFASEWGLGRPGFPDAHGAALALAAQVSAHVIPAKDSVARQDVQFGFEVDLAS